MTTSRRAPLTVSMVALSLACAFCASASWSQPDVDDAESAPGDEPLLSEWAVNVNAETVHQEYPRPQMVRSRWLNLNGAWEYAVRPRREDDSLPPDSFDGQILVPFPIESALSGVQRGLEPNESLWYRRMFELPDDWTIDERVLLHFGAVDWHAAAWVNGERVGEHRGGYDAFTFDITNALREGRGESNELIVRVYDPTDEGTQPRGKQVREPEGIWYTRSSGIWQTVWLEPVPASYIADVRLTPILTNDTATLRIEWDVDALGRDRQIKALATDGQQIVATEIGAGGRIELAIPDARRWSPDDPFLYDLRLTALDPVTDEVIDEVEMYFGMRRVEARPDDEGVMRIHLNGEPLFMFGLLDQGFWPGGLYTAPSDEALRYDLEVTKRLGYNTARKHVKVEPARWYYWCDKLGLLVWQDMPSGDESVPQGEREIERSPDSAAQFEYELERLIDTHYNHPSIVMWIVFNEGWGQYDTVRLTEWTKSHDPTRLVNNASGWHDFPAGDVHDIHAYPGPASPQPEEGRAAVLGEFGGLGLPLAGHTWQNEKNWGYRSFDDPTALTGAYVDLINRLRWLIGSPGLSAAIYTQTTDVEIEVNGVMTYDRAVIKLDEDRVIEAHKRLFLPPPRITTLVETSQNVARVWRYTLNKPGDVWMEPGFDDSSWKEGPAGFGRKGTPGAVVRTEWETPEIWLRRTIELPAGGAIQNPHLLIHHDEDAQVYLNGVLAATPTGYTTAYIPLPISDAARDELAPGETITIAVHCRQTDGGQYIDVGLIEVIETGGEDDQ